jgi:hypothetical protein
MALKQEVVETLTVEEEALVRKVVWSLEMSPTGRCLECGQGRMFHLLRPLKCAAVVGMLRARLGL